MKLILFDSSTCKCIGRGKSCLILGIYDFPLFSLLFHGLIDFQFLQAPQSFCLHVSLTIRIKSSLPCLLKLYTSTSLLIIERWSRISPTFFKPLLSFYLHFSRRRRRGGRSLFFFPWNFTHELHHWAFNDGTTIDSCGESTTSTRLLVNDFQMVISRLWMLGQIRIFRNIFKNLELE